MSWNWKERLGYYFGIREPVGYGLWVLCTSFLAAVRERDWKTAFSSSRLRARAFSTWWTSLSPHFVAFEQRETPVPHLVGAASGVVLDLGPGSGNQLPRFDRSKITRIYGPENNPFLFAELERAIDQQGMGDVYEAICCGVEDSDVLERHGITTGCLDTVLSIQVLCSVEQPDKVARELYALLKPGGKLIFWEHHVSSDRMTRGVQYLWNWVWSLAIGGCNLNRDMKRIIREAGEWESVDGIVGDENPCDMLPRIFGVLIKAGGAS